MEWIDVEAVQQHLKFIKLIKISKFYWLNDRALSAPSNAIFAVGDIIAEGEFVLELSGLNCLRPTRESREVFGIGVEGSEHSGFGELFLPLAWR